jgi:flagellar protein FlaG
MSVESINSSPSIQPTVPNAQTAEGKRVDRNVEAKVVEDLSNEKQPNGLELDAAIDKLNKFVSNSAQRNLSFDVDKDTKEMIVTVRDSETQEVIRQMPTKEALAVAKQIESMLGLILNDKA